MNAASSLTRKATASATSSAFPNRPVIYTMARRDTVFNRRWKRWLVPKFGVFPIQPARGELDARGVASVYQLLHRHAVVLLDSGLPQGGGAALCARLRDESSVPLIVVCASDDESDIVTVDGPQ